MHTALSACVHLILGYVFRRLVIIINNQVLREIKIAVKRTSKTGCI